MVTESDRPNNRRSSVYRLADLRRLSGVNTGIASCTKISFGVHQASAELAAALAEFLTLRSRLDGDYLEEIAEKDIADLLDRVRVARQRCDRRADDMLRARPRTKAEALFRREAMLVYAATIELDQLHWLSLFEPALSNEHLLGLRPRFERLAWLT